MLESTRYRSARRLRRRSSGRFQPWLELLEDRRLLAVFTVTTKLDVVDGNDGVFSLRESVLSANALPGPDQIVFDLGGPAEIALQHGELEITDALTITRGRT